MIYQLKHVMEKARQTKLLIILEVYVLPVIYFLFFLYQITNIQSLSSLTNPVIIDKVLRPLIVALLLINSSRSQRIINWNIFLGIILSYSSFYFFEVVPSDQSKLYFLTTYFSYSFYVLIFFLSIFTLGKSFAVFPAYEKIVTKGFYSHVRHPIYLSYCGFFGTFLLTNLNYQNCIAFLALIIGLYIRATEEEKVLSNNDQNYRLEMNKKPRLFSFPLFIPLFLLLSVTFFFKKDFRHRKSINIDLVYSYNSLNPLLADDWSSFFIINHIYPRLQKAEGIFRDNSIGDSNWLTCTDESIDVIDKKCKRIRFQTNLKPKLISCTGKELTSKVVEEELKSISIQKNWLLPNFTLCQESKFNICFEFDKKSNPDLVLRSIYLRFGWSLTSPGSHEHGIKPNCFQSEKKSSNNIGTLQTKDFQVNLFTTAEDSDINLFASSDSVLLEKLPFYNPISYFLVINGKSINSYNWSNTQNIAAELFNIGIINSLGEFVEKKNQGKIRTISLAIPDYFPSCNNFSASLSMKYDLKVSCVNIADFTENTVKRSKSWDAFISPLTPGIPGKEGIYLQYFSKKSNDNWLGSDNPSQTKFILLGESNGEIQTNPYFICGLKPNPLGLSDLVIDDFIFCK